MNTARRRIVVAMSGGVDSSVVAALLKQQGHDVIGITMQLYDHGVAAGRTGSCCAGQDIHDARRVAEALQIPHYVLDYERRFEAAVMQSFAESYLKGETPIPCVACNQQVKFLDLLGMARELGAEAMATGHYVERRDGPEGVELFQPADASRDQSYFLFSTTRAQLEALMFPLGGLPKTEVRKLALALDLPVADKPDSQDICFVPSGRYADVIERLRPGAATPGDIVHVDGRRLGRHEGIMHFTVGQRRGLNLAIGAPLYVVRLDADRNEVVVGERRDLETHMLGLRDFNWLGREQERAAATGGEGLAVWARIRSSTRPVPATLRLGDGGQAEILLGEGEIGVAKGQACVLYADGNGRARVLGGGWIASTVQARRDLG
ncbi:MAG: tRNA-specific 2-thiouridylase MnmA [Pseudomonadota bacterium]